MPRPPCSHHAPARPVPSEVLDHLAVALSLGGHLGSADGPAPPTVLVRVRPAVGGAADRHPVDPALVDADPLGPGSVDLGVLELPAGVHPADALVGRTVPPGWWAAGLVTPGRARVGDGEGAAEGPGAPDAPGVAITAALLVGRDGQVAHHVAGLAGDPGVPGGRLVDLVRRSLALPTDPPDVPAATWWRALWLDGVVAATAAAPPSTGPPGVVGALGAELADALVADPDLCSVAGWARLRALAAGPAPADGGGAAAVRAALLRFVTPADAAWMDDGCFARWMEAALPSVDELLGLVEAVVPPPAATAIRAAAAPDCGARGPDLRRRAV